MDAYETFLENNRRVENFISMYESVPKNKRPVCRGALDTDILRAGVVFLHASLEEYLRTVILNSKLEQLEYGSDAKFALSGVNLPDDNSGGSSEKKYRLSELYRYKGKDVGELLRESLESKVSFMTFNGYKQMVGSLKDVDIVLSLDDKTCKAVDDCTRRRHKIVHEADKSRHTGNGDYRTTPIKTTQLELWMRSVNKLVKTVEDEIAKQSEYGFELTDRP